MNAEHFNWHDAYEKIKEGRIVESLVSYTKYTIIDNYLYAIPYRINEAYVTEEEKLGDFIILSDEDLYKDEPTKGYINFLFNIKYENLKCINII